MNRNCLAVEIVNWDKKKLDLKKDNLLDICRSLPDDIPIAILNVSGESRTGKSTLLDIMISILFKFEECRDINDIRIEDLRLDCGCLNGSSSNSSGFGWKAGNIPCTKGIRMLNHYFIIPNPSDKSQNMAVLLVDAEGLEANDSSNGSDQVLFGISNLMSSVLILNQKGIIGPSDMTNLRLLVEYCPPEKEKANGSFCGIELLIRDYKYESEELEEQLNEINDFKHKLFNTKDKSLQNNLELIKSCYKYIDCYGLPHPGDDVETDDFKGDMRDISDEFKKSVLYYVKDLLNNKLQPTFENKEVLYSLYETLNAFLSKGIPQLSQMHKIFMNHENNRICGVALETLIYPMKDRFNCSERDFYNLFEEVKNKVETEVKKALLGTDEMINESMEYLRGEMEMIRMEYENNASHKKAMKLKEEEKNKTEEEVKQIMEERKRHEERSEMLIKKIEEIRVEIANRPVQPIVIKQKRSFGRFLGNLAGTIAGFALG